MHLVDLPTLTCCFPLSYIPSTHLVFPFMSIHHCHLLVFFRGLHVVNLHNVKHIPSLSQNVGRSPMQNTLSVTMATLPNRSRFTQKGIALTAPVFSKCSWCDSVAPSSTAGNAHTHIHTHTQCKES